MDDLISRQAAIDATKKHYRAHDNDLLELIAFDIEQLPSVQPETEWNNHTVACLLAELFGDDCACNYNGIDEWLPEKCEVIDACPNPVGVACWEQFLKHRREGEPMSDLISRQAAINAIDECYCGGEDSCGEPWIYKENAVEAIQMIEPLSPAEPKRGKWILDRSGAYCCSECMEPCAGYVMMKPRDKFCKMCGSRNEVTT